MLTLKLMLKLKLKLELELVVMCRHRVLLNLMRTFTHPHIH